MRIYMRIIQLYGFVSDEWWRLILCIYLTAHHALHSIITPSLSSPPPIPLFFFVWLWQHASDVYTWAPFAAKLGIGAFIPVAS